MLRSAGGRRLLRSGRRLSAGGRGLLRGSRSGFLGRGSCGFLRCGSSRLLSRGGGSFGRSRGLACGSGLGGRCSMGSGGRRGRDVFVLVIDIRYEVDGRAREGVNEVFRVGVDLVEVRMVRLGRKAGEDTWKAYVNQDSGVSGAVTTRELGRIWRREAGATVDGNLNTLREELRSPNTLSVICATLVSSACDAQLWQVKLTKSDDLVAHDIIASGDILGESEVVREALVERFRLHPVFRSRFEGNFVDLEEVDRRRVRSFARTVACAEIGHDRTDIVRPLEGRRSAEVSTPSCD